MTWSASPGAAPSRADSRVREVDLHEFAWQALTLTRSIDSALSAA